MIDFTVTPSPRRGYAIAAISVAIAWSVRIIFLSALGPRVPYLTFYPAVVVAAIFGGGRSGLMATTLSAFLVLIHIAPLQPHFIETPSNWLGMAVFLLGCILITGICERIGRDRTRQQKQIRTFEANRKHLQSIYQAKRRYLAGIRHDLRTPLNVIMGYSQLLQREAQLSPEQHQNLRDIDANSAHLLKLMNDVLEISTIGTDAISIQAQGFDLRAMLNDLVAGFEVRTEAQGRYLKMKGVEQLPQHVVADQHKIRIILTEIVTKAIKISSHDGITINPMVHEKSSDTLCLVVTVEFDLKRNADVQTEKWLKNYKHTENSVDRNSSADGVFAISQCYAHAMNGHISIHQNQGQGITLRVELDIAPSEDSERTIPTDKGRVAGLMPGQAPLRILVAEDSSTNRYLLSALLETVGFEVREATNGQEALNIFEQWQPHFIWMDMGMPEMDGMEATRRIKADAKGHQTKVVALTGHTLDEERKAIMAAGCDGFVRKPFREEEIFSVLAQHLGVIYQYDSASPEKLSDGHVSKQLQRLPASLHNNLSEAVLKLDVTKISDLLEEIDTHDPDLGRQLKHISDQFNYHHLLALLKASATNPKGTP